MPPLDRYLKDVRVFLPGDQADDIVNELAENLRAQFEDREHALGRPLTDAEEQAILQEHGKPIMVAARYRPEQQGLTFGRQLIGPALFPSYTQVLTINLAITVVVVIVAAVLAASGQPLVASASGVALAILVQFGAVTLIFVAAERAISGDATWPEDVVRSLPGELQRSFADRVSEQLIGKRLVTAVPRRTSVFDFAVSALTVGWLLVVRPPNITEVLRSGPGWESYFVPVVLVMAVAWIQPVVNFIRPQLVGVRYVMRTLTDLALIGIFLLSLNTGQWVIPTDPTDASGKARVLADAINPWVGVSLAVATVITAAMVLLEVRRLAIWWRSRPTPGTPSGG
jgi:hypothetical protein